MSNNDWWDYLEHSQGEWKKHRYIKKVNGIYYYPEDTIENGTGVPIKYENSRRSRQRMLLKRKQKYADRNAREYARRAELEAIKEKDLPYDQRFYREVYYNADNPGSKDIVDANIRSARRGEWHGINGLQNDPRKETIRSINSSKNMEKHIQYIKSLQKEDASFTQKINRLAYKGKSAIEKISGQAKDTISNTLNNLANMVKKWF